jgi:hypothetical protein
MQIDLYFSGTNLIRIVQEEIYEIAKVQPQF